MKKNYQFLILGSFILGTIGIILSLYLTSTISIPTNPLDIGLWIGFIIFWGAMINEGVLWIKNGKRSDLSDLVAIIFLFLTVFLITRDVMLSFVGAFSIYLLFGIEELKEYEILNKVVLISVITYNFIFIVGILDQVFQKDGYWQDIAFSLSFWLMLILGFAFFGRKYIIVFRFMSVQYLSLLLYVVAWLVIVMLENYFSIAFDEFIYIALIITNLIIYALSGPLINVLMGYRKEEDPELTQLVREVAEKVGMNPNKIQVRYGKYPIINAMAYGAFWNMNMAIIAPDKESIPKDELKGIVAHELGHLKQKHTLILTLISSIEILIFMVLKWPVTMYDFVFDPEGQPFDMWVFILISFVVSIFLYIIVRNLEGHADKISRDSGYAENISKGLYNLESFYATSHEIGLDATLLSEEKTTENNQMLNYYSTSQYLNKMVVDPSRGILLSNFINSHPPSFHRIMLLLNEEQISPIQEAFMPLVFLNKKKSRQFLLRSNDAREKYLQIVNLKIKEKFKVQNSQEFHQKLKQLEFHQHKVGKTFAYLNRITGERHFGNLASISYSDNIAESLVYHIKSADEKHSNQEILINPSIHKEVQLFLNSHYKFRKEGVLLLEKIDLNGLYKHPMKKGRYEKDYYQYINKGILVFRDKNEKIIEKPIFDTKLPIAFDLINALAKQPIFLKTSGTYEVDHIKSISVSKEQPKIHIELTKTHEVDEIQEESEEIATEITSENYTVKFGKLYFPIHFDEETFSYEKKFLNYLKKNDIRAYFILKKAVNSEIDGKILDYTVDEDNDQKVIEISVRSIFNETETIEFKKIDGIFINRPSITLQNNNDISGFTKVINKIQHIRHPERIFK